jgi:hypothetical protein
VLELVPDCFLPASLAGAALLQAPLSLSELTDLGVAVAKLLVEVVHGSLLVVVGGQGYATCPASNRGVPPGYGRGC